MGLNRDFIGRDFGTNSHLVTRDEIAGYASVIGGSGNPAYKSGVAPPSFPVVYELPVLEKIWSDPGLHGGEEEAKRNVLMLVHGEQRMTFHRPLEAGTEVSFSAHVDGIEDKGSGEILALRTESASESGLVCESHWGLFIRGTGSGKKPAGAKPSAAGREKPVPPKSVFSSIVKVPEDITRRYADASNDRNPIHLDDAVAKKAGLKGVVVHGLCTMSMVMQSFIDGHLGGDPARLRRLAVRFSAPVYPGDALAVEAFDAGEGAVKFETAQEDGTKVIKGGHAEFG